MSETTAQKRVLTRVAISAAFFVQWLCTQGASAEPLNLKLNLASDQVMFSFDGAGTNQTGIKLYPKTQHSNYRPKWSERAGEPLNIVRIKADRTLRIRGWQLRENVYFGQAKVANQWGVGLLINKRNYQYGINNRGIAFLKKF